MSETNADCAYLLRMFTQVDPGAIEPSMLHAAAVLSAPGVVDLDPDHTAEILTWALEFCRLDRLAMENYGPYFLKYDQMRADHYDACPPHVRDALRATNERPRMVQSIYPKRAGGDTVDMEAIDAE